MPDITDGTGADVVSERQRERGAGQHSQCRQAPQRSGARPPATADMQKLVFMDIYLLGILEYVHNCPVANSA